MTSTEGFQAPTRWKRIRLNVRLNECFEEQERQALILFAVSARSDDFEVQNWTGYLEEIARQFAMDPANRDVERQLGRSDSTTTELGQDQYLQQTVILMNNRLADRVLELMGSENAEVKAFGPAPEGYEAPWTANPLT